MKDRAENPLFPLSAVIKGKGKGRKFFKGYSGNQK